MGITSVKHWADESNNKGYNMRTNRLFSINGFINALNLIYYHQQWGSIGSMAAMMIITNQNRRIRKTIYTLIGFPKDMLYVWMLKQIGWNSQFRWKGTTMCEQSTISYGQTYGLIRLNLLSLTVGLMLLQTSNNENISNTGNLMNLPEGCHPYIEPIT